VVFNELVTMKVAKVLRWLTIQQNESKCHRQQAVINKGLNKPTQVRIKTLHYTHDLPQQANNEKKYKYLYHNTQLFVKNTQERTA